MSSTTGRTASAVRIAGDDYQHLVAWNEALEALRPDNDVVSVTVEQPDAGNVDDVVLRRRARPHRYIQVKHAVDATTPVGHQWMTDRAKPTASSLMEKFHRSWLHLTADTGPAELVLVTDREIDTHDPVRRLLDCRTQLLVPSIGHTNASQGRRLWADHLNIAEDELMAFLASLRFMTGRPLASERERAATLMWTMGLNYDQRALDSALGLVRDWVQLPERTLEPGEFRAWANDRVGLRTEPGAVVVIEAIDNDPHPDDAAEVVNFVADYMGDTPNKRRQLHDENQWPRIGADIEQAAQRLRQSGVHRVIIRGAMRLPVWFAAGAAFRHVHGFHAAAMQIDALWSSEDLGTPIEIRCETVQAGSGPDIAVCVGIAADPTTAVRSYVESTALPIEHVTSILPARGTGPGAIPDGPTAAATAVKVRDAVRNVIESTSAAHIHLFLATPGAFALLLGHCWNALRPTTIYEHLGTGHGYTRTFLIAA